MMATFLVLLIVLAVLWTVASTAFGQSDSNNDSGSYSRDNFKAESFLTPIPKGYQIFVKDTLVAGISFRKDDALRFINGSNQTLELEREPNNAIDKNAIKVIGVTPSARSFVGYVPKDVAEQIAATGFFDKVQPRLVRTYLGSKNYAEIRFQIIGLKEQINVFNAFLENQPATDWQKQYYKFFGVPLPKGLTTGVAAQSIAKHTSTLGDGAELQEFNAYIDILEEFDDSDFRQMYDVKKTSKAVLDAALAQMLKEGATYQSLDIQDVVDRVIELKPTLQRSS